MNRWVCYHCGKSFISMNGLLIHTQRLHSFPPEHSADSPASGLSGRTTGSEAERSEAGDQAGDLEGNSRVRRRSEAEPPNAESEVSE